MTKKGNSPPILLKTMVDQFLRKLKALYKALIHHLDADAFVLLQIDGTIVKTWHR
jgi:hypothetical protein